MSYGRITDLVLAHLREVGPRTRAQIEMELGREQRTLGDVMSRLCRVSQLGPSKGLRRAHIVGWTRFVPGVGREGLARPIYQAGHGANAPKPRPLTNTECSRRWKQKRKAALEPQA